MEIYDFYVIVYKVLASTYTNVNRSHYYLPPLKNAVPWDGN